MKLNLNHEGKNNAEIFGMSAERATELNDILKAEWENRTTPYKLIETMVEHCNTLEEVVAIVSHMMMKVKAVPATE